MSILAVSPHYLANCCKAGARSGVFNAKVRLCHMREVSCAVRGAAWRVAGGGYANTSLETDHRPPPSNTATRPPGGGAELVHAPNLSVRFLSAELHRGPGCGHR